MAGAWASRPTLAFTPLGRRGRLTLLGQTCACWTAVVASYGPLALQPSWSAVCRVYLFRGNRFQFFKGEKVVEAERWPSAGADAPIFRQHSEIRI